MKKILIMAAVLLLAYGCSSNDIIGDNPTTEVSATPTAITTLQLAGANSRVNEHGVMKPQTRAAAATRAGVSNTVDGAIINGGFIMLDEPLDNAAQLTIDVNNSDFATWVFFCSKNSSKTAYAVLNWDEAKLSDDQQRINLTAASKNLELHWLDNKVPETGAGPLENPSDWIVSAIMGGGKLKQTGQFPTDKGIDWGLAFGIDFSGLPGTSGRGQLQIPYVTKWQAIELDNRNRVVLNFDFRLRGNLIREQIIENQTGNISERNTGFYSRIAYKNPFQYGKATNYNKVYYLKSNAFYQPQFAIDWNNKEGDDITLSELQQTANPEVPNGEMLQPLVPKHTAQDLSESLGQYAFITWAMPVKLQNEPATAQEDYRTMVVPSNGGFVLGRSSNNFSGQGVFTARASQEGRIINLGTLREVDPAVTQQMANDNNMGDDAVMEYPNPLAAMAENNLGYPEKTFCEDPKRINAQRAWTRAELFGNTPNNYKEGLTDRFPDGYRFPSIWDMTFAFPYPASSGPTYLKENGGLTEGDDIPVQRFMPSTGKPSGKFYGVNFPEYLNTEYAFTINDLDVDDYAKNNIIRTSHLTLSHYYAQSEDVSDRDKDNPYRYLLYGIRFQPSAEDRLKPKAKRLYNNHKTVYRYDLRNIEGKTVDQINAGAESYIEIRARYIGDSPMNEALVQDEDWWAKPFPTEVTRYFCIVGHPSAGTSVQEPSHVLNYGNYTDIYGYIATETAYVTATKYNKTNTSMQKIFGRFKFGRASASNWHFPVRPVRNYNKL